MKKMKLPLLFVLVALLVMPASSAFAMHCMKCKDGGKGGYSDSLDKKVFHKAGFLLENQEAIGLTEEQVASVKSLKHTAKKDLIMKEAEIESLALDIKAALDEKAIDVDAVNTLVDKKYDLKKEKTKQLVGTYASLKSTLTDEQMVKAKELWKAQDCSKEKMQCPVMGDKGK